MGIVKRDENRRFRLTPDSATGDGVVGSSTGAADGGFVVGLFVTGERLVGGFVGVVAFDNAGIITSYGSLAE